MKSIRMALVLAFGAAACSSPFNPHEARLLAAARAQWEQRPFANYTFEALHGCFCLPEQVGPVRITVREGAIVSVSLLETEEPVDPAHWFTIEQLYERIPSWAKYDGVEEVSVEYDPILGFPSRVVVQADEGIADAGDTYIVSNVGPA
jgi:hypothetical protein